MTAVARRGAAPPVLGVRDAQRGQATVELVAMLPLVVVAVLSAAQVLAAGAAREAAGQAAAAGAAAVQRGADPRAEVLAAAGVPRERLRVLVDGRRVVVRVRPRALLGPLAGRLEARAVADAGPVAGDGPR